MIKVLFFASLREALNCESIDLVMSEKISNVADVKTHLLTLHAQWAPHFDNVTLLTAVNQQMARNETPVKSGDEVAFFPPVTGG